MHNVSSLEVMARACRFLSSMLSVICSLILLLVTIINIIPIPINLGICSYFKKEKGPFFHGDFNFFFLATICVFLAYLISNVVDCQFAFQEIHAPILSLWGVKIVVISVFLGWALASIVSCYDLPPPPPKSSDIIVNISACASYASQIKVLSFFSFFLFKSHRHYALGLNLVWNKRLFFPETPIFRFNYLTSLHICFEKNYLFGMLRLHFNFLQGYFNNVSEYLRIGPPLYFVAKNYNYRYLSVIIFPF